MSVVIADERFGDMAQMSFTEEDEMIQALVVEGSNPALGKRIAIRRVWRPVGGGLEAAACDRGNPFAWAVPHPVSNAGECRRHRQRALRVLSYRAALPA